MDKTISARNYAEDLQEEGSPLQADIRKLKILLWVGDRGQLNYKHTERDLVFLRELMKAKGIEEGSREWVLNEIIVDLHDLTKQYPPSGIVAFLNQNLGIDKDKILSAVQEEVPHIYNDLASGRAFSEQYTGTENLVYHNRLGAVIGKLLLEKHQFPEDDIDEVVERMNTHHFPPTFFAEQVAMMLTKDIVKEGTLEKMGYSDPQIFQKSKEERFWVAVHLMHDFQEQIKTKGSLSNEFVKEKIILFENTHTNWQEDPQMTELHEVLTETAGIVESSESSPEVIEKAMFTLLSKDEREQGIWVAILPSAFYEKPHGFPIVADALDMVNGFKIATLAVEDTFTDSLRSALGMAAGSAVESLVLPLMDEDFAAYTEKTFAELADSMTRVYDQGYAALMQKDLVSLFDEAKELAGKIRDQGNGNFYLFGEELRSLRLRIGEVFTRYPLKNREDITGFRGLDLKDKSIEQLTEIALESRNVEELEELFTPDSRPRRDLRFVKRETREKLAERLGLGEDTEMSKEELLRLYIIKALQMEVRILKETRVEDEEYFRLLREHLPLQVIINIEKAEGVEAKREAYAKGMMIEFILHMRKKTATKVISEVYSSIISPEIMDELYTIYPTIMARDY